MYQLCMSMGTSLTSGKAKQHNQVLVVTRGGVERRLSLISLSDVDKMVGVPQVQLDEDGGSLKEFKG